MSFLPDFYEASPDDLGHRLDPPPQAEDRETVTALIICCDNERTIRATLDSVTWCDEILVVIDPKSSDATREIVGEYTERVFENTFTSDGVQRNFAIPKASCEWIFVVDSDETITQELRDDILAVLADPGDYNAYYVRRIAFFLGKPVRYCGWGKETQLRLFRRDKGRYDTRRIHAGVQVAGPIGQIDSVMLHDTIRDLHDYLDKVNDFTSWSAADLHDKGKRISLSRLLLRPIMRFFKMYVLKLGFLEGMRGLLLSGFAAFYVFSKYAKLWEIQRAGARQDMQAPAEENSAQQ